MVEENSVDTALYRLAILETQPVYTPNDLVEWFKLRKWVLSDAPASSVPRATLFLVCE